MGPARSVIRAGRRAGVVEFVESSGLSNRSLNKHLPAAIARRRRFFGGNMPTENHHYVPQFLLLNFCASDKLHVFDIISKTAFWTNPKNVMAERNYNAVTLRDNHIVDFEPKFTYIESLAKPVFENLIRNENINLLNAEEVAAIHIFTVVQFLRSKVHKQNFLSLGAYVRSNFPGAKTNDLPDIFEDLEYEKFSLLRIITDDLASYAAPLSAKHMFLMKKRCAGSIYISDSPLVLYNSKDFGPYGNIGIAVPHIEIYLPISPNLVLAYFCPATVKEIQLAQSQYEKNINDLKMNALRTGLLNSNSVQNKISEAENEIKQKRNYLGMILDDKLVPIDKENLLFLNSLQIQWSHRFVAAQRKDFGFAIDCLAKNPDWIKHPTMEFA
jgi:hypothetical protein